MPSRINHVKLITPEPEVINAFLTQVCDVPEGWPLGGGAAVLPPDAPLGPGGDLPVEAIGERRLTTGPKGFIVGDVPSRQFQVLEGGPADFWAVCVSTRDIEGVLERAKARGVPCTPITIADWNERDNIANFFCVVAGLMFEIIRVEPKPPASG
jgi:catechol 2,3-dioxygenase-like lactoylglutathione lyase family enzyme